jgi:hypothetical protein
MEERRRGGWFGGLILIILGLFFLVNQVAPDFFGGWMFLVGLGLVFLVGYVATRQYGYLIPGCILTGLGIPVAFLERGGYSDATQGGLVVFGLGLGFFAILIIDYLVERGPRPGRWWPIIPGGILTIVGAALLSDNEQWLNTVGKWWPLVFIVIGIWIIFDRLIRRPR